jgi:hypothetical protein
MRLIPFFYESVLKHFFVVWSAPLDAEEKREKVSARVVEFYPRQPQNLPTLLGFQNRGVKQIS